jgi:riboflavin synthase
MFTGIIERTWPLSDVQDIGSMRRLELLNTFADVVHGESIAINGVCLTVAKLENNRVQFDVIHETLTRTNLGQLHPGDAVNVERSLRVGSRLDGHFVQGHVDGTAVLLEKSDGKTEWRFKIEAPEALAKYLAPKGSICIDGVSLTIANLNGRIFEVTLIPTTLALTTLADRPIGWAFNLECDMMAKQIVTFLELRDAASAG